MIVPLTTGLLSFGFLGMVAYIVAGPDAKQPRPGHPAERQSLVRSVPWRDVSRV